MEYDQIISAIDRFLQQHGSAIDEVARRRYRILEAGGFFYFVDHYRRHNYDVKPKDLTPSSTFRLKPTAQGRPGSYSSYHCSRDGYSVELHCNLPISAAHTGDPGIYVVDVAVIVAGKVDANTKYVDNRELITFAEVKNFRIYPMALAHFVGIVHELRPEFLNVARRPYGFKKASHFNPTLLTIGDMSENSRQIVNGYGRRQYFVDVIERFELVAARIGDDE